MDYQSLGKSIIDEISACLGKTDPDELIRAEEIISSSERVFSLSLKTQVIVT